jgi:2-succinyl-5-enolpyruvyl-6-hydroxy-3-cyclohexene-1-carboxylate synthase
VDRNTEQNEKLSRELSYKWITNLNRLWSAIIIDELKKSGVMHFYPSPGMRNAPLLSALSNTPGIEVHSGIDERAQAYRALGQAKFTGTPSVLICTSGTALANYYPAIIEAYKSRTPLIILSADRPPELVIGDANQTINQTNIYQNFVSEFIDLGTPTTECSLSAVARTVSSLCNNASDLQLPVHLNLPFRGPLCQQEQLIDSNYFKSGLSLLEQKNSCTTYLPNQTIVNSDQLIAISEKINSNPNGILVIGELPNRLDKTNILNLIKKTNWNFFLDITSSIKFEFNASDGAIPTFDHPEIFDHFNNTSPDIILHIGGRVTSKYYYKLLEENPNIDLIHITSDLRLKDPSFSVKTVINCDLDEFAKNINLNNNFKTKNIFKEMINEKIEIINNNKISYPVISKAIIDCIPSKMNLFLANSTVIRSFDSYASNLINKQISIFANRGASGIEGLIASACGVADAAKKITTLVIGDISFLHDLNSLQLIKESKVIVIIANNYSGGIFSLLPIAQDKSLEVPLTTPHVYNFKYVCQQFDLDYTKVESKNQLTEVYLKAVDNNQTCIIEVPFSNNDNIEIYKKLKTVKL